MSTLKIIILLCGTCWLSSLAIATASETKPSAKQISKNKLTASQQDHAKLWQLSTDEYRQYLKIMQSPRAYFTPNLEKNPLLALALEAKSEQEKSQYADRWVQIQYDNNLKVIAWQLEVSAAWQRNFPGIPRFTYKQPGMSQHAVSNQSFSAKKPKDRSKTRAQLYISIENCDPCTKAFHQQYKQIQSGKIAGVDIHFVGAPSKEEIVQWALAQGLNLTEVNQRRTVTLNLAEKGLKNVPQIEFSH